MSPFVLESLLGVSESDMSKDYELTSFYSMRYRNGRQGGAQASDSLKFLIDYIKSKYTGSTINDRILNWAMSGTNSLNDRELQTLRDCMLE